jgi:hypothetical protein
MTESVIKTKITPYFKLVIDLEDGNPPKELKLCYDYRSIAAVEESTGLDLKQVSAWQSISSGKQFPQIVHGGLHRYPEVTLDEVLDFLNPAAQRLLSDEIFNLMFPGVMESWKKLQDEQATGATADPNVPTVETPNE